MSLRAGLVAAVLIAAGAVPSGASAAQTQQPVDQTINAQTDPDAAAAVINSGCGASISNCTLDDADTTLTYGLSTPQILGDVLYNCAPPGGPTAYTATQVSDTRGETTSVSESVSVTLQGGLIGVASASAEFKAFSSQADTFSTTVTASTSIPVPPGYKGYTTTQVPTINANASYYITDGIKLIKVTGVDLSFPYPNPNSNGNDSGVVTNLITAPIIHSPPLDPSRFLWDAFPPCTSVSDAPDTTVVGGGLGAANPNVSPGSVRFRLCTPGKRCATHALPGAPPPKLRRATAKLTRGGRTYAKGTDIRGRIRLTQRRRITAGRYRLSIAKKPRHYQERLYGGKLVEEHATIRIPVNVCGNTPSAGPRFGNSCTNAKT